MREKGSYGYYVDHTGDGENGDCVYEAEGKTLQCPYEIQNLGGKVAAKLSTDEAEEVVPTVIYRKMAGADDYYSTMQESFVKQKLYTELPLYERYISKDERNNADDASFAGKGKSYLILKPADVMAAFHAIGRAGSDNYSSDQLRKNIIRIAKAKGFTDELPKQYRGDDTKPKESAAPPAVSRETLQLIESNGCCEFLTDVPLREARSNYPIKIISPGTGATAHYPAKVLERDGPKVFKKGTLMFWNHQTEAEESARPEGDLDKLAAITTSDAVYKHDGPKGPGLYADAKVMADYGQKVEERAPHIGLSIRAGGSGDGTKIDGKPVLSSIDYVESVDYVTKAGRGGLALAEAARDAGILPEENEDMTLKEAQDLVAAEVSKATLPLLINEAKRGAREEAARILESVTLPEVAKTRIIERSVGFAVVEANGSIDIKKFREVVVAEAKAEGRYLRELTGAGNVIGMGSGAAPFADPPTAEQIASREADDKRLRKQAKRLQEAQVNSFARLMNGNTSAAEKAATKGRAA
jgi:hypothetical protein